MHYIPHSAKETESLLRELKLKSIDQLFDSIPLDVCFSKPPHVVDAMSEQEIFTHLSNLAAKNSHATPGTGWLSFLGEGCYAHYVPAAVDALISRGEFLTSYTPYQAEICQGNLQASFEFQSMIANLVGLDIANASMYDGASAMVEAVFMARRIRKGHKVLVSQGVHPQYLEVLRTFASGQFEVEVIPVDHKTGTSEFKNYLAHVDTFAWVVQHPNYFGSLEDLRDFCQAAKAANAVSIVCNNEPLTFAALPSPGSAGVDIFAGEAHSLGTAQNFGGPHLGILATNKVHLRNLPGRLVGQTVDSEGKRGFTLTLTTREQHIRREKATSNICTNQFLLALRAAIAMALLGQRGMQRLAFENAKRMSFLLKKLNAAQIKPAFSATVFNEVTVDLGMEAERVLRECEKEKIMAGVSLKSLGMPQALLINVTELHSEGHIETLVNTLSQSIKRLRTS